MTRKAAYIIFIVMVFLFTGCIKDTYDMNKLSGKVHLSPSLAFRAISGDITLSDMVKPTDTLIYDQYNLVKLVFRQDSVVDLAISDFWDIDGFPALKGNKKGFGQLVATIDPETMNFEIEDIMSNISGVYAIINPSIRLYYSNSFPFTVKLKLDAIGSSTDKIPVSLDRDTFALSFTNAQDQPIIKDTILIHKDNSSLPDLISMPPEEITFSGSAIMDTANIFGLDENYMTTNGHILGDIEIEIPLEFSMNMQFTDTIDNFFADAFDPDDDFNWDDFESFEMVFNVENGFPMGISLSMVLYDSINTPHNLGTVDAEHLLDPAPVDGEGKVATDVFASSSTSIVFTHEFFNSIESADQVILIFTLNTTDNEVVKIYSDYRIKFNAALILKSDINVNLK